MRTRLLALAPLLLSHALLAAQPGDADFVDDFSRHRLAVLTDIGNEPDDQMSLVRLLLYSNEIDIEALVATTSTWQRARVQPEIIGKVIAAYAKVRPNLVIHHTAFPEATALLERVSAGQPGFGMAAVGPDKLSAGAKAILDAADSDDSRPLWITVWGGANTLAQALLTARATRSPQRLAALIAKLRVYSISDQDDAGPWIRREFPSLFYIVRPTRPDSYEYLYATWTGISGDVFYRNCEGADASLVTNEWLDRNIRSKGPLGAAYPRFEYIMEGDTPSFLNFVDNGLDAGHNPGWGGWGGRYLRHQPSGETRPIWTQGGDADTRVTSRDEVRGIDGAMHVSDQATIWRWREAFQNDFAARMDWTVKPYAEANHAPRVVMDLQSRPRRRVTLSLNMHQGETLELNAIGVDDDKADKLSFHWFQYREAGYVPGKGLADLEIEGGDTAHAKVRAAACRAAWKDGNAGCTSGVAHLIVAVSDDGEPRLTSYQRLVITVSK
jgi:hypothetical protein